MIRNIRHIQIKKVAYCPNLFKAILTYEKNPTESDDLEYQKRKLTNLVSDYCVPCDDMEKRRRSIDGWERE